MASIGAEVLPTGIVRFTANQGLYLGELPEGTSARVQTLGDTCNRVGIVAHVTPSIQVLEWSKYVAWVCSMATKTLSELSVDDMVTQLRPIGDRWASLMPHTKISALHDVERGKRLEVEETLGYAVRQGAALGIPTPTMAVCDNLIAGINHSLL
jgi:2-dehydropantoate 2-reductase